MKATAQNRRRRGELPRRQTGVRRPKRRRSAVRLALRCALAVFALGIVWIGYSLWQINGYVNPKPSVKADAGIVLGAALWRNNPSPGLKERLDYALGLYRTGRFGTFVVSGGLDHNGSTISEAEGMRRYLMANGVPADRILPENKASSTYENLLFSKAVMEAHGLRSALIVTHAYHANRANEVAKTVRIPGGAATGVSSQVLNMPLNELREVLAYTKWTVDRQLLRFGYRTGDVTF